MVLIVCVVVWFGLCYEFVFVEDMVLVSVVIVMCW